MNEHVLIILPPRVDVSNMEQLYKSLSLPDSQPGTIYVSMDEMDFYTPNAICALLAQMYRWKAVDNRELVVILGKYNRVVGYIKYMGFFEKLGIKVQGFVAKSGNERYMPISEIQKDTKVDKVANDLVEAAMHGHSSDDEIRRLLSYAVGELLKNVQQHSCGTGYIMAQYFSNGLFQIGIADNGIGIKQSYISSFSPRAKGKEEWSDAQWIDEAIKCQSSSKVHLTSSVNGEGPVNRGVGLTMCRLFAKECLGHFQMVSYSGELAHEFKVMDSPVEPAAKTIKHPYHGVSLSIAFNPSALGRITFMDLRRQVLTELGMHGKGPPLTDNGTLFSS